MPQPPQLPRVVSGDSQPLASLPSQLPNPASQDPIAHMPVAQLAVACERRHAIPQPPQSASVRSDVSHPVEASASQSPKFVAQLVISHVPVAQLSPAFASAHTAPHEPQLVRLLSGVSQPFASTPSQSAKPMLQVPMRQVPVEQSAVAFARMHATPQPPQLVTVRREVSQPFASTPSQFAKPASQLAMPQTPLPHVAVAFERLQPMPQPPQFVVVRIDVSQPVASRPSQSSKPVTQVPTRHMPLEQSAIALARTHAVPQLPQSVVVRSEVSQPFATLASQSDHPASHVVIVHMPVEQSPVPRDGAHGTPQAPQLVSVFVRVSQPFDVTPSQLPNPGRHSTSVQMPAEHEATAFANVQVTPHAPQFVSVRMDVSQPSVVIMLQSSKPAAQVVTRHMPLEQSPVPLEGAHTVPHEPQSTLVVSGVSQPLIARPSQSPQLRSHDTISHVPVSHDEVALGSEQTEAHAPQWSVVVSGCSQPSTGIPLQSPYPGSQRITEQRPASQPATAT
jgi:hypothetical protein